MRTLNIIRTLVFYDVPQLFIAVDAVGVKYLCSNYEELDDGSLHYIAVQTSDGKLNDFIKGHIDLRNMFTNPEQDDSIYLAYYDYSKLTAHPLNEDLNNSMLPIEGFYFDDAITDDAEIIQSISFGLKPDLSRAFLAAS